MKKISTFICKHYKAILIIAILLLIPSIIGIKATRINYDILVYLPENIETIKGENILSEDFDMGAFSTIIIDGMQQKDIEKLEEKIRELDNVEKVVGITDIVGKGVPIEMLPKDLTEAVYKDGSTIVLATFKDGISSDATLQTIQTLRDITDERCKISGMSSI